MSTAPKEGPTLLISTAVAAVILWPAPCRGGFDAALAEQKLYEMDRACRSTYERGACPYYGRWWANHYARRQRAPGSEERVWDRYVAELRRHHLKPLRLDCTLFAQEILKAGMDPSEYERLLRSHRRIWGPRGLAGWSVAHLLTEEHGWKAYALLRPGARYYHYYLKRLVRQRELLVWKQPAIKVEGHFIVGKQDAAIEALLRRGRLGWGFSDGGIHTWITSGVRLKECHWDTAPSRALEIPRAHPLAAGLRHEPFFETTRLVEFDDYGIHLVVFPPEPLQAS